MTNRTSTGSTVRGIHPIPIPKASTSAPAGSQQRSGWTTAQPWFSTGSDSTRPTAIKPLPKTILARREGKLRSRSMKNAVKSPAPAPFQGEPGIFSPNHRRPSQRNTSSAPLFPRNPLFPALRSASTAVPEAIRPKQIPSSSSSSSSSKFLAVTSSSESKFLAVVEYLGRLCMEAKQRPLFISEELTTRRNNSANS